MRAHTITTTKLALLLMLLALGALGLVACGGGDDDQTTAASATETTAASETETQVTACGDVRVNGPYQLMKVAVIEGDVACRVARGVVEDFWAQGASGLVRGSWRCDGSDFLADCWKGQFTPSVKKIQARGTRPDQTAAASETETTADRCAPHCQWYYALPAESKSCGAYGRWRLAVVERGVSCREARRVMSRVPDGWICAGGDRPVECVSEAGETIRAPLRQAVLRRSEAAEAEELITKRGNEWAPLFAKDSYAPSPCRYMGQPACERMYCERVPNDPIRNCTPPSSEFRKSFADATVERVVVEGRHATAEFSNGESVEFEGQAGKQWFVTERWIKTIARRNFQP